MPRRAPDTDRVREAMAREAEVVESTEQAIAGQPSDDEPPGVEPDALAEQLEAEREPEDSGQPDVGPITES